MRRRDLLALDGAAALAVPRSALAQAKYPDRPIRLVVPFPPGGAFDAVGRPWADRMKTAARHGRDREHRRRRRPRRRGRGRARAARTATRCCSAAPTHPIINPRGCSRPADLRSAQGLRADRALVRSRPSRIAVHPSLPATDAQGARSPTPRPIPASCPTARPGARLAQPSDRRTVQVARRASTDIAARAVSRRGSGDRRMLISGQIPMIVPGVTDQIARAASRRQAAGAGGDAAQHGSPRRPTFRPRSRQGLPGMVSQNFIGLFAPTRHAEGDHRPGRGGERASCHGGPGIAADAARHQDVRARAAIRARRRRSAYRRRRDGALDADDQIDRAQARLSVSRPSRRSRYFVGDPEGRRASRGAR